MFTPLGLEQSFFFPKEIMTKAFVVGHMPPPDDPDSAPQVVPEWALPRSVNPAGGVISSVAGQLRYARFHLGNGTVDGAQVLSPASLAAMKTTHGPGGSLGPYVLDGVGVSWLLTTIGGEHVAMHGGSTNGQQSSFLLLPDRNVAIALLTNSESGAILAEEATLWVLEQLYDLTLPEPEPVEVAPEHLAEYVADYDFGNNLIISVTQTDGELTLAAEQNGEPILDGAGPLPLVATDRALFDFAGAPFLTDFVRDDSGQVAWIRFSGRLAPRMG